MCFMGIGRLHVVEGSMNTEQYINVIKSRLIPQATEWYPDGNFTFQQDKAPCHMSRRSMEFFADNNLDVLQWPVNSPNRNIVEYPEAKPKYVHYY